MIGLLLALASTTLTTPAHARSCSKAYVWTDTASPTYGRVTRDVVVVLEDPGLPDEPRLRDADGLPLVLEPLTADGVFGLPWGLPPGTYDVESAGGLDPLGSIQVVPTGDWSPGPPPSPRLVSAALDWKAEPPGCALVQLIGRWGLYLDLALHFDQPPESGGWYLEVRTGTQVDWRLAVPRDGGRLDASVELQPELADDGELCIDVDLIAPRGGLAETLALPCRRVPMKPPLPACGDGTSAALLLPLLWWPAGLRRRDRRGRT